MAMNGDTLGLAIKAAIDAVGDKTNRDDVFKAMGNAIVTHIQTLAQVSTIVTVASVAGVMTGGGVSGPGAGTGTGLPGTAIT